MAVPHTPDFAEVVINGRTVGQAYWCMSDETLVVVTVEPVARPLVLEWAKELGGEFQETDWDKE